MTVPVSASGDPGDQVTEPGQLQYGGMLMGVGTSAGWRELVGWRDLPGAQIADSRRPQAHGTYAGAVFGDSLVVTFTYLVRGLRGDKALDLAVIEANTPMDGVDRPLVVNDGDGPWLRMARVIARSVPQGAHYAHAPVECSVQFLCADPRRYALTPSSGTVRLPTSSGGLAYPLTYPLDYGESSSGALVVRNDGSEPTPLVVTFYGPLDSPIMSSSDWTLGFDLNLADGETLTVDTSAGTALLNGNADRLYTIRPDSDPLERVLLPPGGTSLSLTAPGGTGHLAVSYRDARM